jgi:alginate O-acetyltransferase complex protein AlgJ
MSNVPAGSLVVLVLSLAAGWRGWGADAAASNPERTKALKETLEVIVLELQTHGGSFEKWGESLKPYREALDKIKPTTWPWPAKRNFVFQGKEMEVVARDTFDNDPEGKRPFEAILAVDRKLKEQGIDLIFAPLPDKLAIYPDYLSDTAPADRMVVPAVRQLLKKLLENDVEVVDLYPAFYAARKADEEKPLYYDKDSHWRNIAAQLAAEHVAKRLMRYDFVQKALAAGYVPPSE